MALDKTILNQFKQVTKAHGLKLNSAGLNSLTTFVNSMDEDGVNAVLPYVLPLLQGLHTELKDNAEKVRISNLLAELNNAGISFIQKKRALNALLVDKAMQDCLMEQLSLLKAKPKNTPQPEKPSFAQKALESFMQQCSSDVQNMGARNAYDPLGMFFNHLFAAFGLILDVMLDKMGIQMPEPAKVEAGKILDVDNPGEASFIPPVFRH